MLILQYQYDHYLPHTLYILTRQINPLSTFTHTTKYYRKKKKKKRFKYVFLVRLVDNGMNILYSLCAMMRMLFFCSLFCISIVFSQSKKYVYLKQKKYYKVCQNILFLFDWKKNTWITFKFIFHLVDIRYRWFNVECNTRRK